MLGGHGEGQMLGAVTALLIAVGQATGSTAPMKTPQPGMWSSGAAYLWPGPTALRDYPPGGRAIRLGAPDRSTALLIGDEEMTLQAADGRTIGKAKILDLAEILWSPDSQAFTLTQSDGGWVGDWSLSVYRPTRSGLQRYQVEKEALRDFAARPVKRTASCAIESPNVAAIAWTNGSKELLLVVERHPHSSACDPGAIRGYVVNAATGAIQKSYSAQGLSDAFPKALGSRFRPGRSKE